MFKFFFFNNFFVFHGSTFISQQKKNFIMVKPLPFDKAFVFFGQTFTS
jgi:hypothetical protein